jgi:hypothetical protein
MFAGHLLWMKSLVLFIAVFFAAQTCAAESILVFDDNPINLEPSFVSQAMDQFGLEYTLESVSIERFAEYLTASEWDLVIMNNTVVDIRFSTVLDLLNTHVVSGGRLIIYSAYHSSNLIDHELWGTLGVDFVDTNIVPYRGEASPVYWWEDTHLIFTYLRSVPEFLENINYWDGAEAWSVQNSVRARQGFQALGGYSETPSEGTAAIVVGNSSKTVYLGYADFINQADLDADSIEDASELWMNLIYFTSYCNVNMVSGLAETSSAFYEACETLDVGPGFTAKDGASVFLSSGREINFKPGFLIEKGATLSAAVCGQSLCETSASPMPDGCHSCVVQICDIDPTCCGTEFDQSCLDKVYNVCNLICE